MLTKAILLSAAILFFFFPFFFVKLIFSNGVFYCLWILKCLQDTLKLLYKIKNCSYRLLMLVYVISRFKENCILELTL